MAGVARREAEAAVGARARPAAAPSLFRALRPGDVIVKPPSRTTTMTTSTTTTVAPAAATQPAAPLPVAEIFRRRFQRTIARARED